jgi:hypothetical protein
LSEFAGGEAAIITATPLEIAGENGMQPTTVNSVTLRIVKEKNNRIRASKLLEDLDHSVSRSTKNISISMTVLDRSNQVPFGNKI